MVVPLTLSDKCHMDHHIILDGTLWRTRTHSSDFSLSLWRMMMERNHFFLRDKTPPVTFQSSATSTSQHEEKSKREKDKEGGK